MVKSNIAIWDSGVLVYYIWCTFHLLVLNKCWYHSVFLRGFFYQKDDFHNATTVTVTVVIIFIDVSSTVHTKAISWNFEKIENFKMWPTGKKQNKICPNILIVGSGRAKQTEIEDSGL